MMQPTLLNSVCKNVASDSVAFRDQCDKTYAEDVAGTKISLATPGDGPGSAMALDTLIQMAYDSDDRAVGKNAMVVLDREWVAEQ